jgi:hypothetical protein
VKELLKYIEDNFSMNNKLRVLNSATVLCNAVELVTRIVKDIAGNDISTSINNNTLTSDTIASLVAQRISTNIANK